MKKTFYYAYTPDGNRERQMAEFHAQGASDAEIYMDTDCGKPCRRGNWEILKRTGMRDGDTLVIPTLDCLSDHEQGVSDELQWIGRNHIRLKVMDIPATMQEYTEQENAVVQLTNELMLELYNATVLKKKKFKLQKQTEGIHAAREKGVRFGRPPMKRDPKFEQLKKQWENGEISLREGGRQLGVTHKTFQKWVTESKTNK